MYCPSLLSFGSCKPSTDSRLPKQLLQTNSAHSIFVQVGRQIPLVLPTLPSSHNPLSVHVFSGIGGGIPSGRDPRSGIAGSEGKYTCNLVRCCEITLCRGCTILHSYQQHMKVPVSPKPHQPCVVKLLSSCQSGKSNDILMQR